MLGAAGTGFATGFSLILAIGAQNAFVLRQGMLRRHVFWLCLLCAGSDAVLIGAGVMGFGALVTVLPGFPTAMALFGAAFLLAYGASRFWMAWRGNYALALAGDTAPLGRTLAIAAAFTWLNPHVYLDTLGLIGAVSTQFSDLARKFSFVAGAVTASFVFFFSLGYGARFLAPVLSSPRAWRMLDAGIGVTLWVLAIGLIRQTV